MSWETKKVKIVFDDDNQTKVVKGLVLKDDEHTITLKGDYDGKDERKSNRKHTTNQFERWPVMLCGV